MVFCKFTLQILGMILESSDMHVKKGLLNLLDIINQEIPISFGPYGRVGDSAYRINDLLRQIRCRLDLGQPVPKDYGGTLQSIWEYSQECDHFHSTCNHSDFDQNSLCECYSTKNFCRQHEILQRPCILCRGNANTFCAICQEPSPNFDIPRWDSGSFQSRELNFGIEKFISICSLSSFRDIVPGIVSASSNLFPKDQKALLFEILK